MLTEQEKRLLAEADAMAKAPALGGLENYLREEIRATVKENPAKTSWAIHFYSELTEPKDAAPRVLQVDLLEQANRMAEAAVAYDLYGQEAFDFAAYLANRKRMDEFLQIMQRYRGRLHDSHIKSIVVQLAADICQNRSKAA